MRQSRKGWTVFLTGLLDAATHLFLAALLTVFLLPQLGFSFDTVLSGSMEPAIGRSDLLLIDRHDKTPEPGEIAVFHYGQMRIIHRVTEKTAEGYRTKGDANTGEDPFLVRPDMMEGRCCAVLKGGKQWLDWFRSPACYTLGACLCLLQGLRNRFANVNSKQTERRGL